MESLEFTQFDLNAMELSWVWLNDPEIRSLTMTPHFTREEQWAWYCSLASKKDYLIWAVQYDNRPVGALGLKHIQDGRGEYWGYIGERQLWGRGIGRKMVGFAFQKGRELNLRSIYLRVGLTNERAAKLYEKMGFKLVRSDDHLCEMEIQL